MTAAAIPEGIPGFSFVWQWVTMFAFLGALVAYRRKGRDPDFDEFRLITRYSATGAIIGLGLLGVIGIL